MFRRLGRCGIPGERRGGWMASAAPGETPCDVVTVTIAVPSVVISLAGTMAVNCVALT